MLETLKNIDTEIFLFLNGMHSPFFDFLMYWISSKVLWTPLYLYFIFLIYRRYGKNFWMPLLLIILAVGLSDFLSVHLFKNHFQRLRPCHQAALEPLVHLVKGKCGGSYGFVSSHAANMFALATGLWLTLGRKATAGILLFLWASLIAYSRIYLGVHFPSDIIGGALLGASISLILNLIATKTEKYPR